MHIQQTTEKANYRKAAMVQDLFDEWIVLMAVFLFARSFSLR